MRLVDVGPAAIPMGRTQGQVALRLVRSPSPERPIIEWETLRHPATVVKTGNLVVLSLVKRREATLALGAGLQWFVSLMAVRQHSGLPGPWTVAAVMVNTLGLATLATRGWRGGYVGWALPARYHRSFLRHPRIVHRVSVDAVPAAHIPISIRVNTRQAHLRSDTRGRAQVDLVADLGLTSSADDRPVLLTVRGGDSPEEIFSVRPSRFLYRRVRFAAGTLVYPAAGTHDPPHDLLDTGKPYVVIRRQARGYLVRLAPGESAYVEPRLPPMAAGFSALPSLVTIPRAPDSLAAPSRQRALPIFSDEADTAATPPDLDGSH